MQPGQIVVQRFRAGVLVQDMDRRGILVQRTYSCKYPSVQLLPGQRLFEFRIHGRRLFQVIRPGQTLKQRISYGQVLFQMYLPSPGNDYDVFNGKVSCRLANDWQYFMGLYGTFVWNSASTLCFQALPFRSGAPQPVLWHRAYTFES